MNARSPDTPSIEEAALPPRGFAADASAAGARAFFDPFDRLVTMIGLIDLLPDLADDIRAWRPRDPADRGRESGANEARDGLDPVARHALDAVVTGMTMLGLAAATLCENAGGRLAADEIAVCREIGASMASLLERARALIEAADTTGFAAARARLYRSFLENNRFDPIFPG